MAKKMKSKKNKNNVGISTTMLTHPESVQSLLENFAGVTVSPESIAERLMLLDKNKMKKLKELDEELLALCDKIDNLLYY